MKRFLAMLLLPLSLVPVAFAVPYVDEQHDRYQARYLERDALPAPQVAPVDAEPVPRHPGRVPALVYHGINDDGGKWNVTQESFARQMAALDAAGFETVDAHTYARFVRGEDVRLPPRPILITFDDGRLDSFRGADAVLAEHGFRATMFAISDVTVDGSQNYLSPDELREMEASGRWDIQFHAGEGHELIDSADDGRRPFYAALEPGETIAGFSERVEDDLDTGLAELGEIVPDAQLGDLFAVPYSDFGQTEDGDLRVAATMASALTERFSAVFVQRAEVVPAERGDRGVLGRYEPTSDETPQALLRKLRDGLSDKEA